MKKKLPHRKKMSLKKWLLCLLFFFAAYLYDYDFISPSAPALPGDPPKFYSTQAGDHLQNTLISSIRKAEESIVLLIYTLKDPKIIQALNDRAKSGVLVSVIYDATASSGIESKLDPAIRKVPRASSGLMHLKLLVIDKRHAWLGSANMTRDSLNRHDNLIANLDQPEFAQAILQKFSQLCDKNCETPLPVKHYTISGQPIELHFLPDSQEAVTRLKELMRSAKKTIKVAMYTFTRADFAHTLAQAKRRGVKVEVVIDESTARGASSKIVDQLKRDTISVLLSSKNGLMHHKFVIIDDEILAHGSANWTKAAFKQNDDYVMILKELTQPQKKVLNELWRRLTAEGTAA